MKNILFIVPDLSKGGAQRVVARLSKELANENNIYIVIFENNVSYEYKGELILLPRYNNRIVNNLSRYKKIRKIKKELSIDVSISFLSTSNILNILTSKRKDKTVISIRNYTEYEFKNYKYGSMIKYMEKMIYNKSWKVVAVSNQINEYLVREYQINQQKLVTIYNPYDVNEIIGLSKIENNDAIVKWKQNSLLFINVGRLEYQKNHKLFIDIIKYGIEQGLDCKGLIIGQGTLKQDLIDYVERLRLTDNIKIIDHQSNPFTFMNIADIYLLTSYYEGFPNALVEGMICGCAAVSVNCKSGPSEILIVDNDSIYNAKYGFLLNDVYKSTIDLEILRKLFSLLSLKDNVEELRRNSVKRSNDFDISIIIEKWRKLIYEDYN